MKVMTVVGTQPTFMKTAPDYGRGRRPQQTSLLRTAHRNAEILEEGSVKR
jgi:UDP-N-acetylglucosamine 2-epimerase